MLRTALTLSLVTGQPFQIGRIRARRPKPGLLRQHLACVEAAGVLGAAEVAGAGLGSTELTFRPGPVRPGSYTFRIGSAGSTTLLLQTILPPLLRAGAASELVLEGGTHNPFAPPFPFLDAAFLPLLRRMGHRLEARLERAGFYPNGGGRIRVAVDGAGANPAPGLSRLDLPPRARSGEVEGGTASAAVRVEVCLAGLPRSIAERELAVARGQLGIAAEQCAILEDRAALGPGNTVHVRVDLGDYAEVFTGFGSPRVRAEQVTAEAVGAARSFLEGRAAVGPYLADQLLLPLALGPGGRFVTGEPSGHTRTNAAVIERFLGRRITLAPAGDGLWVVAVEGMKRED